MKQTEDAIRDLVSSIYEDVTDFSYTGSYEREIKELAEVIDRLIDFKIKKIFDTAAQNRTFFSS